MISLPLAAPEAAAGLVVCCAGRGTLDAGAAGLEEAAAAHDGRANAGRAEQATPGNAVICHFVNLSEKHPGTRRTGPRRNDVVI